MAVNRVLSTRLGEPGSAETTVPLLPAEAIAMDAAVDAFTRGVAYVNHEEDVAGTLEPGKVADVAVLDQDLLRIAPSRDRRHLGRADDRRRPGRARRRVSGRPATGQRRLPFCEERRVEPGADAAGEHPRPARDLAALMCCI